MTPQQWLWPVLFYLVGSFPTGYLMGRARGIDVRQHGSGNIGATNVGRVMGRNWGLAAFACDFLKGFLPLFLLQAGFKTTAPWPVQALLVACGTATVLGHNYTPWLGFKGGKGIATSAGILGALLPWTLLVAFSLWLIMTGLTRIVSLGSLLASASLPVATAFFYPRQWVYLGFTVVIGLLAIWRHRGNVARLRGGTEPRLGAAKKETP